MELETGHVYKLERSFATGMILSFALALLLPILGTVFGNLHLWILAILPLTIGIVLPQSELEFSSFVLV